MENRALRILIVVAGIILVIIILIITFFSKKTVNNKKTVVSPTPIESSYQNTTSETESQNNISDTPITSNKLYYQNSDFSVSYDSNIKNYVITKKTPEADKKITDWLAQHPELGQNITIENGLLKLPIGDNINQSGSNEAGVNGNYLLEESLKQILKTFKIITNGKVYTIPNPYDPLGISPSPTNSSNQTNQSSSNFIYYQQCNGNYDNYPLPDGCNICKAGCGPTTVAMIVASYADSGVKPPTIVDQYQNRNQPLSCAGSGYSSAKLILEGYGLQTSDYFFNYGLYTIDEVANKFKRYINNGWTIFALANFRPDGGGHYFWITDIDNNNTVWAYDPYYGRFQSPPINENSRYPFPKYKIAFAVKKNS